MDFFGLYFLGLAVVSILGIGYWFHLRVITSPIELKSRVKRYSPTRGAK